MSNFAFLAAEFPAVHEAAMSAERNAAADPTAAAFFAGKTVEIAVKWAFRANGRLKLPYQDIVAGAGFTPLEATNVAGALALLEQHGGAIRGLFTDVQMPGGRDGFSLAREAAKRWPEIWIVVASGQVKPGLDDLPKGATFIAKPSRIAGLERKRYFHTLII